MRTPVRPAWPAIAGLGLACIVVGAILLAEPFRTLPVLARLTALALGLAGAGEVLTAPVSARSTLERVTGGVWVVAGVALAAWPDITIQQIAVVVGLALVAGGLSKLAVAVLGSGDERLVLGLSGASAVVAGGFALSWPEVTTMSSVKTPTALTLLSWRPSSRDVPGRSGSHISTRLSAGGDPAIVQQ